MASISTSNVTVGTTEVVVVQGDGDGGLVVMHNESIVEIAIGPSGLTTTNGYHVAAGATISFNVPAGLKIYALAGTAGNVMNVMQIDG